MKFSAIVKQRLKQQLRSNRLRNHSIIPNSQYRTLPQYGDIRTVFTVHNLQYQGIFPISDIEDLISLGGWAYDKDHLEFYGQCSFMKGGLVFADAITTVSPTYSQEIQTAYYGEKLDGLLRARAESLTGILNGIDTVEYDPMNDPLIEYHYSAETFSDKVQNKLALQRELGKLGFLIGVEGDNTMFWNGETAKAGSESDDVAIDTYEDHRMAMAFAPVALTRGNITINNPDVVSKSYPRFWEDLKKAGFKIA